MFRTLRDTWLRRQQARYLAKKAPVGTRKPIGAADNDAAIAPPAPSVSRHPLPERPLYVPPPHAAPEAAPEAAPKAEPKAEPENPPAAQSNPANVKLRLVIWNLNGAIWQSAPTAEESADRREIRRIVVALAGRGIASALCCQGDQACVQEALRQERVWDYFVFPSIIDSPIGPRVADIIAGAQVPAAATLFISDDPAMSGEAEYYAPGILLADAAAIPNLLENPLHAGTPDTGLTRLNNFKLLQHRRAEAVPEAGDPTPFLRQSGIVVTIEHDLEPHLDRVIDLINGAGGLNETPGLPESMEEARTELRRMLSAPAVQAGILHVRNRYADFGYSGVYILQNGNAGPKLRQLCVAAGVRELGVETWLYNRLGRPPLAQRGAKAPEFSQDAREIDWITVEFPETMRLAGAAYPALDHVFIRGSSDLKAVAHYFGVAAVTVHGEFNSVEDGVALPLHHSVFARHALQGVPPMAAKRFADLGYEPRHFQSALGNLPKDARGLWLLNFWGDAVHALYRHKPTGLSIPVAVAGFRRNHADLTQLDPAVTGIGPAALNLLKNRFTFTGQINEADFKANVSLILQQAGSQTQIFIVLSRDDGGSGPVRKMQNGWLRDLAAEWPKVTLLEMTDFAVPGEEPANSPAPKNLLAPLQPSDPERFLSAPKNQKFFGALFKKSNASRRISGVPGRHGARSAVAAS